MTDHPITPPPELVAQPEPQGPTDEEIDAFIHQWWEAFGKGYLPNSSDKALVAAALAHWGRPAIEPVPVSERWPEFSDCDLFERVWAFNPVLDHWKVTRINQFIHTHWMPYWAMPVPGVEGADA